MKAKLIRIISIAVLMIFIMVLCGCSEAKTEETGTSGEEAAALEPVTIKFYWLGTEPRDWDIPCIPGVQRLLLSVYGDLYPCERVSEASEIMKIGHIDTGFDLDKVKNLLNIGQVTEKECKNCWAFSYCYLCAAYADDLTSISPEKKKTWCDTVRASVEYDFKDYCTLIEYGYDFDKKTALAENVFNL